jgi:hypothetical protein
VTSTSSSKFFVVLVLHSHVHTYKITYDFSSNFKLLCYQQKSSEGSSAKEAENIWTSRAGWACVKGCGACCVLDKGPTYPPIEEVLTDAAEAAVSIVDDHMLCPTSRDLSAQHICQTWT